ncbi:MAG: DUF3592 domain-containing protein [Oscillospiraceae bacterium]
MKTKPKVLFLLIGILFMLVGIRTIYSNFSIMFSYEKTTASVTSCEKGYEYDSDDNRTTVYYTYAEYTVRGENYSAYAKLRKSRSVGEDTALYYDKAAPDVYVFKEQLVSRIILSLIFTAFGILFIVCSFIPEKTKLSDRADAG